MKSYNVIIVDYDLLTIGTFSQYTKTGKLRFYF